MLNSPKGRLELLLVFCILFFLSPTVHSNDSAASTAAGGIRLVKENRISIASEKLTIGEERITVEYEFLNESDADIAVEVAFPVPSYRLMIEDAGGPRSFDDFRVWVDGREIGYQTDAKAVLDGADCSDLLRRYEIDIVSFGRINTHDWTSDDFGRLSQSQRKELEARGLFTPFPSWTVQKTYHWNQLFPTGRILRVRHEYRPVVGFTSVAAEELDPDIRSERKAYAVRENEKSPGKISWPHDSLIQTYTVIDASCIDRSLQKNLRRRFPSSEPFLALMWIDYILTTANNWKTPIKNFELIVERPKPTAEGRAEYKYWYVSFCWDGTVKRIDSDHFSARIANFVPQNELKILFIGVR